MGVEMTQVFPACSRASGSTSPWQTMTQFTWRSRARWTMSGWSPQMTTLSGLEKSRFSRLAGRAMVTSPETRSGASSLSWRSFPSSTEMRLKTGMSSTRGLRTVVMS